MGSGQGTTAIELQRPCMTSTTCRAGMVPAAASVARTVETAVVAAVGAGGTVMGITGVAVVTVLAGRRYGHGH